MKPESKDQAFNLYFQTDMSQTDIAKYLDVNRKTVYLWVKEGQWEYLKQSARQTPGVLLDQFSRQLVALNESILSRSDRPFPTKEEADIQRKLSLTIKNLRKGPDASERVAEMVRFVELVKTKDMKLLEKLVPILTEFTGQLIPDPDTYMAKMKAQYRAEQAARAADKAEAIKPTFETDPEDLPPESESSPPENTAPESHEATPPETPKAPVKMPPGGRYILKSGVVWMGHDKIYEPATGKTRETKGFEMNEIANRNKNC